MRRTIEAHEPERDPVLAEALRPLYPEATLAPEALQALRARIRAAASEPGREEPSTRRWRRAADQVWRRRRYALPALLAATLAGILLVREFAGPRPNPVVPAPSTAAAVAQGVGFASAEQALEAPLSDADFARVLTRENDPAALLAIAVAPTPRAR